MLPIANGESGSSVRGKLNEILGPLFDRKITDYTLALSDQGLNIEMDVAGANYVTVPPNSDVSFPVGAQIPVVQYGAGITSIVAGVGVTIRSSSGVLTSPGQYSPMVLSKIDTDEWYLWNGLQSSVASWQDWSGSMAPVGFSSLTIQKAFFKDDGNMVTIWWEITGTSNATSFQFSLPEAISSEYDTLFLLHAVYNGATTVVGRAEILGGASLVDLQPTAAGGVWTASGLKSSRGFLVYMK